MLPQLDLWLDPHPSDGPQNMAVDRWLAENCDAPVLRSYRWTPGWGSHGYFVKAADLPPWDVRWVRRWTGGGIVDHTADWTYTLFVPRGFGFAEARGAESYRIIHSALARALRAEGIEAWMAGQMPPAIGGECFLRPAEHDLLDASGRKLAGAGQRRSVRGLLHQGSVVVDRAHAEQLALALADGLSTKVLQRDYAPDPEWVAEMAAVHYDKVTWGIKEP